MSSAENIENSAAVFRLFIPLVPVAKARPRLGRRGTFTPMRSKNAETEIRYWLAKSNCKVIEGPLQLHVVFHMPRPKSLKKGTHWHTKRPDADNLVKQIMDAGNGFLWADDASICELYICKIYCADKPGFSISIYKLL